MLSLALVFLVVRFNSRTPGGVRHSHTMGIVASFTFQFTHPGRGATQGANSAVNAYLQFQFTHPGRGATHYNIDDFNTDLMFQFTHPGRGATSICLSEIFLNLSFNSRTPGGVRPETFAIRSAVCGVSIHAPREGCDKV